MAHIKTSDYLWTSFNNFRELNVNIKTLNNIKGKSIKLLNFGVSIRKDL